ncbi:glycosyl transferase [Paracoccus sp. S-4012]|uniref:DUF5928 domain-containing protein n=1 Tax=Paracoccus sp. S-4012 TaxID=2665648 RepID=UPI0012AFCE43|nr:DUF5928 domain-containing protein [Paracoccus sp. S-4012]MRX50327.1 glycosyl transferase [Paracoccus sp. S-4012]
MAKIAFLLLAHKDPRGVIAQAQRLTATGDFVAIHFDRRARPEDFAAIRGALGDNPNVAFAARRHRCGWGQWSLVAATLAALRAALTGFPAATHFYMLSGDCMPIKPAEYVHAWLDREDADFIESFDFFTSGWIKTGFREERLIYRHPFNERTNKRLFYLFYEVQRRLGLTRPLPQGLRMMIGSQWWCLRRATVEKILALCAERPDIPRFFRTTWIPDETFFQSLVNHLVPREEIRRRTLTFLMFTDYGMPVVFHDDHHDLLLGQDYLFARKISPEAEDLRARLGALWTETGRSLPISGEGPALYRFLTRRGREGRRFAPRFWERADNLRRSHRLLIVVCKQWHIAKRLAAAIRAETRLPAVDYLFNELDAHLPDLGGIETSLPKRERHRRALIRLLFERFGRKRLVICLDPHAYGVVTDLAADRVETRLLLIETPFDDAYLRGHIVRAGLAAADAPREVMDGLIAAARTELELEVERLRDLDLAHFHTIGRDAGAAENAAALAAFLDIAPKAAQNVLDAAPALFAD